MKKLLKISIVMTILLAVTLSLVACSTGYKFDEVLDRAIPVEGYKIYEDEYMEFYYPTDFVESEVQGVKILQASNGCNITMVVTDEEPLKSFKKSDLAKTLEQQGLSVKIKEFGLMKFCGKDMLKITMETTLLIKMNQTIYMFNNKGKTITITYTNNTEDNSYADILLKSILIKE